jgi:glyoxylase-like metal-dependent hydrolase (beta-lactamase superfamily II)
MAQPILMGSCYDPAMNATAPLRVELDYPFASPPDHDSYIEVAPGVRWLRFPLPFALNHINLWLLEDGPGWTLVDTGINSAMSRELWERHFETTLEGRPITRVIVTHFHPDHVGNAGFLVDRWGAEFLASRSEWLTASFLQTQTAESAIRLWGDYYRAAGLDEEMLKAVALRGENYAERVGRTPPRFNRLAGGDVLSIGGRAWRVVIGTGHSPELICLYAPEDRLLIASDQILPGISPNVSVSPTEPDGDPLSDFLASCRSFAALDERCFVLPMHGRPFYRLRERLAELARHHGERLDLTIDACRDPITIAQLLPIMFKRTLDFQQTQFAVGEALAHANHLVSNGRLARIGEARQGYLYRSL